MYVKITASSLFTQDDGVLMKRNNQHLKCFNTISMKFNTCTVVEETEKSELKMMKLIQNHSPLNSPSLSIVHRMEYLLKEPHPKNRSNRHLGCSREQTTYLVLSG